MILQTQGMRFRILCRLAIQFSKTELHPSKRDFALVSSLARRGVPKTTGCVKEGRRIYQRRPVSSREFRAQCSDSLVTEGVDFYIGSPFPVKSAARPRCSPCCGAKGAASTPSPGFPSSPAKPASLRPVGASSSPHPRVPSRRRFQEIRCLLPGSSRGGARLLASPPGPVKRRFPGSFYRLLPDSSWQGRDF